MTQVDFLMASNKYASEGRGVSPRRAESVITKFKI